MPRNLAPGSFRQPPGSCDLADRSGDALGRSGVVPLIRVTFERATLRIDHAESLAGGSFHHPPALDESDPPGAERFKSLHLRLQVIRLDVQVDTARMTYFLNQNDRLVLVRRQLAIVVVSVGARAGPSTECVTPEVRRSLDVLCVAIDDEGRKSTVVHTSSNGMR